MDWIRRVVWLVLLSLAAAMAAPGCHQVSVVPAPGQRLSPVTERFWGPSWSVSTSTLLNEQGLEDLARHHPRQAFFFLEQGTRTQWADPQWLLALAELADQIGRTTPLLVSGEALSWSRDAAVYAVFCLAELGECQLGTMTWCTARDVHNDALARCLRLVRTHAKPGRTTWPERLAEAGIVPATTVPTWTALAFDTLQLADEFTVTGLGLAGRRGGLGVPLIAHYGLNNAELSTWKPYGPRKVVFAASAVIQPRGPIMNWREEPVELVLHDPLGEEVLNVGRRPISLAGDLTSSLVRRLTQSPMRNYEYLSVVDPDFYSAQAGIYALDPYQPGKVPVVLVQGLWSSPTVWIPMLDVLRGDPALRASYQFWVVLNPSGYPLPLAALSLRRSLREIRQRFDPQGIDPALNNMVILGKSTGGQITRMLVQPSGEALWNAVFRQPIHQVRAAPELRADLVTIFFSQPEPYVRRVIFLTTAHRGGKLAGQPGVRLGIALIRRNNPLRPVWAELEAANGRAVFQPSFQNRVLGSIDGMEAGNPLLTALNSQPIAPQVTYHSIIANVRREVPLDKMTDGLVTYRSAHLDGAASEHIVTATHTCEADPQVIAEVRRILHLHLTERIPVSARSSSNPDITLERSSTATVPPTSASTESDEHTR